MLPRDLLLTGSRVAFAPADAPPAGGAGAGGAGPSASPAPAAAPAPSPAPAPAPAATPSMIETPADPTTPADAPAGQPADAGKTGAETGQPPADETPEAKAAREKAEGEAKVAESLKSYEVLKLPEGMPADQDAFNVSKQAFAEIGLPVEHAQKIIDVVAPRLQEAVSAPYKQWGETQSEWIATIGKDAELRDVRQTAAIARKGIEALMGDKAKGVIDALAFTGAGNNPEIFRAFYRLGKMVGEPGFVGGKGVPGQSKSAKDFYPNTPGMTE